jgi:hypothetical protein
MSDYDDRGAYTPPSDRLAFDPRQPVRGGGPAPVTLIVSALALVGVLGGVFFLYRDGFRHRGEAPALVGAPLADARSPAGSSPADANAAPAGIVLDRTTAPAAPPAPAIAAPPLPPVASAAPPPAPSARPPVAAKSAPPQVVTLAPDAPANPAPAPPKKLVVAVVPAPAPHLAIAAPQPSAEHPVARHASPITIASLTDAALAHRTRTPVRQAHADQAPRTRLAAASSPIAPPPSHHAIAVRIKGAQAATAASNAAANRSAAWVQIGAFSSQTQAEQGWRDVARLERGSMAGKGRAVQPIERDDGATLYRTYVTGFASVTAAQAFCADLRAAARACIVK